MRQTQQTRSNDTSSRSHAICQISLKDNRDNSICGKLILVDLAGSERAQENQENEKARRSEAAEINKSLLALKECIRAMSDKGAYVPFRSSKLTLVLRDSFQSKKQKSKVIMIACLCPGSSSVDHTLNTLYYVDRLKGNINTGKEQITSGVIAGNSLQNIYTGGQSKEVICCKAEN